MYELLIRVETLCIDARPLVLFTAGALSIVAGLLLWLAGAYFSSWIMGLLGAIVGGFCGLLVSEWLDINVLVSMSVGAGLLCVASVLFRNSIIILLAVLVFALAGGSAYSSMILGDSKPDTSSGIELSEELIRFSRMDLNGRLAYMDDISSAEAGFFDRLKALTADALESMGPHKWKLAGCILLGAAVGGVLIWLVRRLVLALSYSGVGTLLIFVGAQSLCMLFGFAMCSAISQHRRALSIVYFAMVGIGAIAQLLLVRRGKKVKEAKVQAD